MAREDGVATLFRKTPDAIIICATDLGQKGRKTLKKERDTPTSFLMLFQPAQLSFKVVGYASLRNDWGTVHSER